MRCVLVLCCLFALPAFSQFNGMSASANGSSATITVNLSRKPVTVACVTGAPYSGTPSTESVQTLADGTHITRPGRLPETTRRDSAGRVRTERDLFGGGAARQPHPSFMVVKIQDPVAGYAYMLDSVNQVAHRVAIKSRPGTAPVYHQPAPGTHTSIDGTTSVTESLGAQTLFGVSVVGTKTTTTYPAGSRIGNDHPVTSTSEVWESPVLDVAVSSRYTTPEGSVQTTGIPDLSTAEPDPSLFQIPAGYKIVDETGPFTFTVALTK